MKEKRQKKNGYDVDDDKFWQNYIQRRMNCEISQDRVINARATQ